jgi:hypothetical protein
MTVSFQILSSLYSQRSYHSTLLNQEVERAPLKNLRVNFLGLSGNTANGDGGSETQRVKWIRDLEGTRLVNNMHGKGEDFIPKPHWPYASHFLFN